MHRNFILNGIVLIAFLLVATNALGQQQQIVVIGAGFGIHTFSKTDSVRQDFFLLEKNGAGVFQLYGEWYPLERLGLGLRFQGLGLSETLIFVDATLETEQNVVSTLLTVQFLPFIADDGYVRIGLVGGIGPSTYKLSQTLTFGNVTISDSVETSGIAVLAGIYIDWGGEDFGARFGFNSLTTNFDDLQIPGETIAREVNGSGTSFYFDLRWAFD